MNVVCIDDYLETRDSIDAVDFAKALLESWRLETIVGTPCQGHIYSVTSRLQSIQLINNAYLRTFKLRQKMRKNVSRIFE